RLFREMREGKHPECSIYLISKIVMASKNINLRDPAIYRIRFAEHHRTGDKWCIYPMYSYAHPLEDVLENITHSICTLEFEDQRAFYNWTTERAVPVTRTPQFKAAIEYLNELKTASQEQKEAFVKAAIKFKWKLGQTAEEQEVLGILNALKENPDLIPQKADEVIEKIAAQPAKFTPLLQEVLSATVKLNFFLLPHQYEFNRLNLTSVVMSKRKLISLVKEGLVDGWDDPRMPTLVGLRRRGYSPEAMRLFCERIGVSKQTGGWIDYSVLENSLREVLDSDADRRIAVQRPIKLVIDNWPEGKEETVETQNHPLKPERGTRPLLFNGELWIEEDDFSDNPPKGYRRLTLPAEDGTPGQAVRLRHAYVIRATSVERDANGNVTTVHAEYYPDTKSGTPGANSVKAKAAIHWLTTKEAVPAEIRLYDRLFTVDQPDEGGKDFKEFLNKNSKTVLHSYVEPSLKEAKPEDRFQFERNGYYCADQKDFSPERLVFNLSVPLKESFKMPPKKQ
ncbi:MAG: glutamate--tRNA ligase family protein, partial [Burkholderiales bacterium]|nr:glutamate--tRNA ligase family protein [Burkholderiales bacterium]